MKITVKHSMIESVNKLLALRRLNAPNVISTSVICNKTSTKYKSSELRICFGISLVDISQAGTIIAMEETKKVNMLDFE
ncbi:hypothetical protein OLK001_12430 [Synechocystis sp. LKSZ1]